MLINVIKVENKGVKISDGSTIVPVLVATVSNFEGSHTQEEMFAFAYDVSAKSVGLVSSCGAFCFDRHSRAQYELVRSLPNFPGTEVYGDDTGFKLRVRTNQVGEHGTQYASDSEDITIYYEGIELTYTAAASGYKDFEYTLPVLLVDDKNNLVTPQVPASSVQGIHIGSDDPMPLAMSHSKYLITHYQGELFLPYQSFYTATNLINSHINMDNNFNDPNDPFDNDDDSGGGGGSFGDDQDNWDDDSDPVPVPPLPSLSAVDTGFITLFNPTVSQLQNLATYLWSNAFDINNFKKVTANPMDVILGLSIVPVDVPASTTAEVMVGNQGSGVYMLKANSQYVELDCGTIAIHEKDHSYLDYSPYTKVTIILPFIGAQDLSIDELNGQTMGVIYHIDVLSGACIAYITIDGNVIHQYAGQCSVSIPITSQDFTQTIMALGQLVVAGVGAGVGIAASGGLAAPIAGAMVAGGVSSVASGALNVANSKPAYSKTGSIGGSGGLLAVQKPYLIFEYPRKSKPAQQQTFTGYPSNITFTLGQLFGFTQIQDIHLENISCTDEERDEMLSIMRGGIIL